MKKFMFLVVFLGFIAALSGVAHAASEIDLDGGRLDFSNVLLDNGGTTLVPIDELSGALGVETSFDDKEMTVTARKGDTVVQFQLGSPYARLNEEDIFLRAVPRLDNGKVLVPLRFLCEAMGAKVYWNADLNKVIIVSDSSHLYRVDHIIDKSALAVEIDGAIKTVNAIGIDGVENPDAAPAAGNPFDDRVMQFVKEQLEGKYVYIEYDARKTDKLGRIQAYIFVEGNFYNADLLRNGYAKLTIIKPNEKYAGLFFKLQQEAQTNRLGRWSGINYVDDNIYAFYITSSLFGYRICLDPGHGGSESGAVASGYDEKDLNLLLAVMLKQELDRSGFDIIMTRTDDTYLTLAERGWIARNNGCEAMISCHFNAFNGQASGFEAIYTLNNVFAQQLGQHVLDEVVKLGIGGRGVWTRESESYPGRSWYGVLRESEPMPGVILEGLFIDNPDDVSHLSDPNFLRNLAKAYARGICAAYGVQYVE